MNKISIIGFISAITFSFNGLAAEDGKVIWSCKQPYGKENILWLVEWGDKSYIKVFDERIQAKYTMDGLRKRWNWELGEDSTYVYAITLAPDLYASYYDFSLSKDGTATAKEKYICSKS